MARPGEVLARANAFAIEIATSLSGCCSRSGAIGTLQASSWQPCTGFLWNSYQIQAEDGVGVEMKGDYPVGVTACGSSLLQSPDKVS